MEENGATSSAWNRVGATVKSGAGFFLKYETQRFLLIRNKRLSILYSLLTFGLCVYIVFGPVLHNKGYQVYDDVHGAISTKVKGIIFTNSSDDSSIGVRTWDVADLVIPPKEHDAFFVMTNVVVTAKQHQTTCAEDPTLKGANCTLDPSICMAKKGRILRGGNGPLTGKCVDASSPAFQGTKSCQIWGWCPVEINATPGKAALADSDDFTVFIKNNVEFPRFHVKRRNLPEHEDNAYLKECLYDSRHPKDRLCPIFTLGTIVEGAGVKFEDIAAEGGVIQIIIDWTCNLNHGEDDCVPEYSFRHLDNGNFSLSRGFNFRYADKFMEGKTLYRTLYKAYGIHFLVTLQGQAGKFDFIRLVFTFTASLAIFKIATIICNCVVRYCLDKKKEYNEKRLLDIDGN